MIAIRAARPEDAAAIAAIYAPYVLTGTVSFESEAPDARAMRNRMAASNGLYPWIVATNGDAEGGVLAYAYATRFRDRPAYAYAVETSIYVSGMVQQQGTGRLLYEALIDTLRQTGLHAGNRRDLAAQRSLDLDARGGRVPAAGRVPRDRLQERALDRCRLLAMRAEPLYDPAGRAQAVQRGGRDPRLTGQRRPR
jgi:L-amino acid N-acyltransferase YncA